MKSTILSLLPFASLALAESACDSKTYTSTKYVYETATVTPVAVAVKQEATPAAETCSRRTVTTTEVERVTVTVDAAEVEDIKTVDVTSTSTRYIKTTITVRPSVAPSAASSSLSWGGFSNATYHSSGAPMKPTLVLSSGAPMKPTSALPDFSLASPVSPSSTPAGEAPAPSSSTEQVPSSETPAASEPSYTPEAAAAPDTSTSAAGSKRGEATFYGGNTAGGKCSFTGYTIPSGLFGTAISDSNWAGAQACGQCVSVTGPSGNKITAMVTDQCPGCGPNHVDLYPEAFAKLADPSKGIINVSWDFVPCGISSPIVLKNKSGTSKFWFSMQVMNANVGVSTLEVSVDGGKSWKGTKRMDYNFFENASGFGTDSVDVRITGVNGKSVVVKGVSIQAGATKTAGGNL